MGKCRYCGQEAGFLKHVCTNCKEKHVKGLDAFQNELFNIVLNSKIQTISSIEEFSKNYKENYYLSTEDITNSCKQVFIKSVNTILADGVLTDSEELNINSFISKLELVLSEKDIEFLHKEVGQTLQEAIVLKNLGQHQLPNFNVSLPIILGKNEQAVTIVNSVDYYKLKTKTIYTGRSQGISVRICKGVTYRIGASRGTPTSYEEFSLIAKGSLIFTNKALYFYSCIDTIKIPYNKIQSINTNGAGLLIKESDARKKTIMFDSNKTNYIINVIYSLIDYNNC